MSARRWSVMPDVYFCAIARSSSVCGLKKLSVSGVSPGSRSVLLYVDRPASHTRQYTCDHPQALHASSMWRTPGAPHAMFGFKTQSEWVRGALRMILGSVVSPNDNEDMPAEASMPAEARRNVRRSMVFTWWGLYRWVAGRTTRPVLVDDRDEDDKERDQADDVQERP